MDGIDQIFHRFLRWNALFSKPYTPSRAGCWPGDFLRDYRGSVVGDAYAGHHALFTDGLRTEIGCLTHVRRKFNDLRDQEPEALAMVHRFAPLYHLEAELRRANADPATVRARRQRDAVPLLADIRRHLDRLSTIVTPQHPLGRAVSYALNQWTVCTRYADSVSVRPSPLANIKSSQY